MISNTRYWFFLILIILVYLAGMFVTLFEYDSAQFAVMAMRMVQENDFINLFKGTEEYLDKPHMHYWLAAISYKIFGLHDWAYRIPGILATLLGAFSCYGLGKLLYNKEVGKVASLIFMTAQTIMLSNIDVRTDAVLTGFTAFAIWQIATYIERNSLKNLLLGAFGAGIAFSTKGQIAILVIGLPILCHLGYSKKWKLLFSWKVLVALVVFGLTISPILYAYYLQFDLHPEKVIRGKDHRSGILFILWEQSFERLSGEGVGKNSSDYFFFFHTFLWVFLPWTILGLAAYWTRIKAFFNTKFRRSSGLEFLTIGGITIIFIIISFAQFKLPHYLNITIPLFAVLTASFIQELFNDPKVKKRKVFLGLQYFILGLVGISSILICFFVFKFSNWYAYILFVSAFLLTGLICLRKQEYDIRLLTITLFSSLFLNAVMNLHFYPSLLKYQAGSTIAGIVAEKNIPVDQIYKISPRSSWAMDFYNQHPIKITETSNLSDIGAIWVYGTDDDLQKLKESGYAWDEHYSAEQFRITRLQPKFLNPSTREQVLNHMHLIHLKE
ncbi:ArnT family glycosyltransferase [Eudoraea adriatica]|uniref:ArnT family glycosyltransferase n=1 Tax=Eudoraea adriatica TaxID=446681 RepID=UPI00037F3BEA|nr:glycosyltransferase family 39 protein [Eudoraea adriatica]